MITKEHVSRLKIYAWMFYATFFISDLEYLLATLSITDLRALWTRRALETYTSRAAPPSTFFVRKIAVSAQSIRCWLACVCLDELERRENERESLMPGSHSSSGLGLLLLNKVISLSLRKAMVKVEDE